MDILALFNVGSNLMFSLGILFILIFTIFYVRQRLSDYDNKINSMFQLVSKMANEIRNLKTPLPPIYENEELSDFKTDDLKVVSMTIDEDDDDDIYENNNDDNDEEDLTTHIDDNSILTSNLQNELERSIANDLNEEESDVIEELEEEEEEEQEEEQEEQEEQEEADTQGVKLVEFDTTLDSKVHDISIPNYKKLKFDELKSLVSTKGLASEIQRLKKAELVSLLEEDYKKQNLVQQEQEL